MTCKMLGQVPAAEDARDGQSNYQHTCNSAADRQASKADSAANSSGCLMRQTCTGTRTGVVLGMHVQPRTMYAMMQCARSRAPCMR